ncbi:hypothetical protein AB0K15_04335 [Amycolatopsis sp. NPDC049253]|uniref:hypothetical protein n=1 Tax=Amycolatopsis sp. NPDC049253 TaxID=3155274 RepID=UPI003447701D
MGAAVSGVIALRFGGRFTDVVLPPAPVSSGQHDRPHARVQRRGVGAQEPPPPA